MGTSWHTFFVRLGMCLAVIATVSTTIPAQTRVDDPVVNRYRGPFWKVSTPQSVMYILGTVPYGGKTLLPLPPLVDEAFKASDTLALENDTREDRTTSIQYMFNTYGKLGEEQVLTTVMEPRDAGDVARVFDELGMPFQVLNSFRPWVLWYLYPRLLMDREQVPDVPAPVSHFLKHAGNRLVYELEGPELMLRLMSETSDELMARVLAETVRNHVSYRDMEKRLVALWKQDARDASIQPPGPSPSIQPAASPQAVLAENQTVPVAEDYLAAFMKRRQQGIQDRLSTLLEHKGTYFVVVDSAFVQGPQGIPAELAALGCLVEAQPLFP